MSADPPDAGPAPDAFSDVFRVYEVRREGDTLHYYGAPLADYQTLMREVWPRFDQSGYDVELEERTGEYVLVATPEQEAGFPTTNLVLFALTVLSTLYAGTGWYYVQDVLSPELLRALPFTLGVLGVLGTHELGHYVLSKYHDVDASLPYFIPVPTLFGTMGALIRMKGQIPDRDALFDIGVAGPLAGLVATTVVGAIGLLLPPLQVPDYILNAPASDLLTIEFHYPLLLHGLSWLLDAPLQYPNDPSVVANPLVVAAWIGAFVTVLNLIPVGQLDGGHILRAMLGPAHERVAPLVPFALFGLAGALYVLTDAGQAVFLWVLWGFIAAYMVFRGSAVPLDDTPLDRNRIAVGAFTFVLGALCFVPVPVTIG